MKKTEIAKRLEDGDVLLQGIMHGSSLRSQSVMSKKTGQRRDALVARQTVLTANDVVAVSEWLPDDATVETWKPAAKKGDPVVIIIEAMEVNNGAKVVTRGKIEPLVG